MQHHVWSVPVCIVFYIIFAWISKNNSEHGGKWFWWTWAWNMVPLWAIVSKYSKNIMFDGMLYDVILMLTYVFTMIYLGADESFTTLNRIGIVVVITGFIMMKVPK